MTKKTKTLLLSTMTLMLCVLLISTATFALYSQRTTISNHLEAGKLEVGLWRTGIKQYTLNSQGYLEEIVRGETEKTPSEKPVFQDFTGKVDDNFFGLTAENLKAVVPGAWFESTLRIANGGDVAFRYDVTFEGVNGTDELLKKVDVIVTPCDKDGNATGASVTRTMFELESDGKTISYLMGAGTAEQYLTVRVAFSQTITTELDDGGVSFDLVIEATQSVDGK
ncbi:MAG: hypothetical protein E7620_00435 [Ruminococcaceae bacterium]|nr:hypothetical protein [Oscillospiraceae bacterium]